MNISCVVIDDEPLSRKGIKEYIDDVGFLKLLGEFDNPLAATDLLDTGLVQLLFLDIQMPRISGIDFFKTLSRPPAVIFTTAYPQYALEGFEVDAMDYLVKPISFERFLKAAFKAKQFFEVRQTREMTITEKEVAETYFFIKADNKLIKIFFDEILFVEARQNYVIIHTLEKKHISYLTLKSVEAFLPSGKFIRPHKSFLVAAEKITSIDGNEIKIGNHPIPLSRSLREAVMDSLLKGKFLKR